MSRLLCTEAVAGYTTSVCGVCLGCVPPCWVLPKETAESHSWPVCGKLGQAPPTAALAHCQKVLTVVPQSIVLSPVTLLTAALLQLTTTNSKMRMKFTLSSNMSPVRLYWFCASSMLLRPLKLCRSPTDTVNSVSVQLSVLNRRFKKPLVRAAAAGAPDTADVSADAAAAAVGVSSKSSSTCCKLYGGR